MLFTVATPLAVNKRLIVNALVSRSVISSNTQTRNVSEPQIIKHHINWFEELIWDFSGLDSKNENNNTIQDNRQATFVVVKLPVNVVVNE